MKRSQRAAIKTFFPIFIFTVILSFCFSVSVNASGTETEVQTLAKGKTCQVTGYYKVSSSKERTARVEKASAKNYTVTALRRGKTTLNCYNKNGKLQKKIYLLVTTDESFLYNQSSITLTAGNSRKVSASTNFKSGIKIKYSSSDTGIAKVNENGKIKAVSPGTATISAKFYYKGVKVKTIRKTVKVKAEKAKSSGSGTSWTVTQYGDQKGSSEMFYTITSDDGLIIIDGGVSSEEKRLREIIAEYDNKVTAWIITHAHPDHIGAFMKIYKDPQGIKIKKIYSVEPADKASLEASGETPERIKIVEEFKEMDIPELTYVYKGDHWKTLGLKFEVLSAYSHSLRNKELKNGGTNLLNNGSMMFRVSGAKNSMLFCADVGVTMTDELVDEYGESLKSDYVQMSHHAKGGLKPKFYKLVSPKGAFFDCSSTDSKLSTVAANKKLIRSLGATVYTYKTTPNQIVLK